MEREEKVALGSLASSSFCTCPLARNGLGGAGRMEALVDESNGRTNFAS